MMMPGAENICPITPRGDSFCAAGVAKWTNVTKACQESFYFLLLVALCMYHFTHLTCCTCLLIAVLPCVCSPEPARCLCVGWLPTRVKMVEKSRGWFVRVCVCFVGHM